MFGRSNDVKQYIKLEKQFEKGKITYDELVTKGGEVLAREQANCSHAQTEYDKANGTTWCANDSCGIQLS
ncbi:hypothetical protein ACIRSS_23570 [Amycolatopsis sp. NPDC101161]|uniref:hypothetical protein n=1 Tax=Amycolatopsis sp. NPDC101161 TaxID=3363940 RepID=UPI0038095032